AAPPAVFTLSLHDALPISSPCRAAIAARTAVEIEAAIVAAVRAAARTPVIPTPRRAEAQVRQRRARRQRATAARARSTAAHLSTAGRAMDARRSAQRYRADRRPIAAALRPSFLPV